MDLTGKETELSVPLTSVVCRSVEGQTEVTSWVEAAGQTLWVFLPAVSASFSPEPYRAKGCLLSWLSSLDCCAGAGLTRWERQACLESLEGLLCLIAPVSLSTSRKDKGKRPGAERVENASQWNLCDKSYLSSHTVSFFQKDPLHGTQ